MTQLELFPHLYSPGAIHANHFPRPGSDEDRVTIVTSGLRCLELSENVGPLGSLEKMLLGTSAWGSTIRYLTWKVKDTPAGRLVFRLAVSRPDTKGKEFGWWPTPDTQNYRDGTKLRNPEKQNRSPGTRWGMSLHHAVAMFPTITRTDAMEDLARLGRGLDGLPAGLDFPRRWADGSWEEGLPRVTMENNNRVSRLKGIGNAIVPQIAHQIISSMVEASS